MDLKNQLVLLAISEDADWEKLKEISRYLSDWGYKKIFESLKGHVKTIVIEPSYTCKDHRNLYSNYYSKKFKDTSKYTERLHFFNIAVETIGALLFSPETLKDGYLGYMVIRPVRERCIGRSVLDPFKIGKFDQGNTFLLSAGFSANINGQKYAVKGYPYTSQDTDITVCAHSALWGVCRFLSEKYSLYAEHYPFDLVRYTQTHNGRTFPYRGMTYSDYSTILSEVGAFPVLLRLKKNQEEKTQDENEFMNLCTYVESGFPTLASMGGHVVSIIGHTINYDKTIPADRMHGFIDSSFFLKQFVVVDDNWFPYQLLGYSGDPKNYGECCGKNYSIESIATAVSPLPEKVFLPAEKARKVAMQYFSAYKSEIEATGAGPLVTRLFLTTNRSFKSRKIHKMKDLPKEDRISFVITTLNMPHFIWVMEISPIELYKIGKCTAEIVLDPTSSMNDEALVYLRIGNCFSFSGQKRTIEGNPVDFPQYTHNLGER